MISWAGCQQLEKSSEQESNEFIAGYPTDKAAATLFEEFDYQVAVQAYVWATSAVNSIAVQNAMQRDVGMKPGEMAFAIFNRQRPIQTIMTANDEVVYIWPQFINTAKMGPVVLEVPAGTLGLSWDIFQRALSDIGNLGPDGGKGGKYLYLPVGYDGEIPDGYFPVRLVYSDLFTAVVRTFPNDPKTGGLEGAIEQGKQIKMYPLSEATNPSPNRYIVMNDKAFDADWPKDERYFELLAELINTDRAPSMALSTVGNLRRLGIEKGKPFAPDARAQKILKRAAQTRHDIVRAIAFNNRFENKLIYPDRQWEVIIHASDHQFMPGDVEEVEERGSWYQLVGNAVKLAPSEPGTGIFYCVTYKDSDGDMLDGSNWYMIRMPANVPVEQFWQIPVYSNQTRSLINTGSPATKSSTEKLAKNDDGSVDIHFGPKAPSGGESNWIKTIPGEGWFVLLRLYGPKQVILDKSWKPEDIRKTN